MADTADSYKKNKIKTMLGLLIKKKKESAKRGEGALKYLCLHSSFLTGCILKIKRLRRAFKGCADKVGRCFSYLGLLFLRVFLRGDRPDHLLA